MEELTRRSLGCLQARSRLPRLQDSSLRFALVSPLSGRGPEACGQLSDELHIDGKRCAAV